MLLIAAATQEFEGAGGPWGAATFRVSSGNGGDLQLDEVYWPTTAPGYARAVSIIPPRALRRFSARCKSGASPQEGA
eukprot:9139909-Pyramimonas_sp.AAC.1